MEATSLPALPSCAKTQRADKKKTRLSPTRGRDETIKRAGVKMVGGEKKPTPDFHSNEGVKPPLSPRAVRQSVRKRPPKQATQTVSLKKKT